MAAKIRLLVFAVALFVNGALLFTIQPIVGKLILPRLGGTPEVWQSCMQVFGIASVIGFGYAFLASRRRWIRWSPAVHLVLVALPLVLAAFDVNLQSLRSEAGDHEPEANPVVAVFMLLGPAVGPSFLVLVANALLLPRWFAETDGAGADDPYFLHAATGLGSLAGLLGYPSLVEPNLWLITQAKWWTFGFIEMACLVPTCAILAWRGRRTSEIPLALGRPTMLRRIRWIGWTALAGTLFWSATRRFTEYTPMPLAYLIPLALFVLAPAAACGRIAASLPPPTKQLARILGTLTLVLVVIAAIVPGFSVPIAVAVALVSGSMLWVPRWLALVLLLPAILLHLSLAAGFVEMSPLLIGVSMGFVYIGMLVCFGEVVRGRPSPQCLVEFFACMAVGEWLGPLLQLSLAPLGAFQETFEYAMVAGFALAFGAIATRRRSSEERDENRPHAATA